MNQAVDIVVGTPICRLGAYIIDKFLANQKEIQRNYPQSELVLATEENDFVAELEELLSIHELRGRVILYKVTKPDYARIRVWNIACGREALRHYVLRQTAARYLLSLDADLTCDPSILKIMEKEIQGYDVAISGQAVRVGPGTSLGPVSCSLLTRSTLEKIEFRCYEFKNGEFLDDGVALEIDLFKLRLRIRKGFFLSICHYRNENEAACIDPHPLGLLRRITDSLTVRYILHRTSIMARHDVPIRIKYFPDRIRSVMKRK